MDNKDIHNFLENRFYHRDCGCIVEFDPMNPNLSRCLNDTCDSSTKWTELPLPDRIKFDVQLFRDGLY
jgi:hypothetical protein